MDLYFTAEGDVSLSSSGDLALVQSSWRDDVQQAYIRMMTDEGDYLLYPKLGASLSKLFGKSQSPATGAFGTTLIKGALDREQRFINKKFNIKAVPVSHQSIRFDVFITSGSRDQVRLSIEQSLGI